MVLRVVTSLSACLACGYSRRIASNNSPFGLKALGNVFLSQRAVPSLSSSRSFRSLQPTQETGQRQLLKEFPDADGRGTTVAILDTGCDVAAAGLLTTSDGKPKYIDFIDCTGGGDVDTSKKVTCDADIKEIVGLSGRKLRLGQWADGVNEFRVGAVRLYELMASGQVARVKRERKVAFEALQRQAVAEVSSASAKIPSATDDAAMKAQRKDLDVTLKQLNECMKDYEDAGPLLDIVLFRDAKDIWRVVVATEPLLPDCKDIDLTKATPMAPFRHERQVGDLGFGTAITYVVQVYDDGNIVSIVIDAGSHGTHVAGIVAAHFEDALERSGVAPGAQVLACKIGDGRLDSAETGTGLVRALIAAKEAGCELINLSYGEPFFQCDSGRVSQAFTDAVRKWGMTVFTSAGNSGPALSTLGAPGHLSAVISVGAHISPAMMADQYSMLRQESSEQEDAIQSTSYWFTSRGPTYDGWLPSLCAPGGAIAPIPRSTLQGKAQYHGTSMASPNACGVAACVLSALRQSGIEVGPVELRRALENSATPVEIADPFAQGKGLINAYAAYAYALEHHGKIAQDLEFEVTTRGGARGIYLRDATELSGPKVFPVVVKPLFQHAYGPQRSEEELEEMLNLDLDLKLSSDVPWVTTPDTMVLSSGQNRENSFSVRLDLEGLTVGVHFGRVHAIDASDPARGSLFSLPITVVIPHSVNDPISRETHISESKDVQPMEIPLELPVGAPIRHFITAPERAEWAEVKLVTRALPKGPHVVIFHAVPSARSDMPHSKTETKQIFHLHEHSEKVIKVPVQGGSTMELCMQLSWFSNPTSVALSALIDFHSYGTGGSSSLLRISASDTFARFEVDAPLRPEKVCPKAELTHVQRTLRPTNAVVSPGSGELDALPASDAQRRADPNAASTQIHQMVLTYEFELSEDETTVMPRVASLHDQIYDSPLDSMIWRLDNSKTGALICYGGAMHDASAVKLRKGAYKISLLLRHPSPSQLQALEDLPVMLRIALKKAVNLKIVSERNAASSAGFEKDSMANKNIALSRSGHMDLYVLAPSVEDMPSDVTLGDSMLGTLAIDKDATSVSSMPIVYEAPPKARKKEIEEKQADDEKTSEETLQEAMLDAKVKVLATLRKKGNSSDVYERLSRETYESNKDYLPLLLELLEYKAISPAPGKNATAKPDDDDAADIEWRAEHMKTAVDTFITEGPIDVGALAQYWGVSHDDSIEPSKEKRKQAKEMEAQRKAVRKVLFTKARYLAPYRYGVDNITLTSPPPVDAAASPFISAVRDMKKWVSKPADLEESDHDTLALILADYEISIGHAGAALEILRKRVKEQPTTSTSEAKQVALRCLALYRALGWSHLVGNMEEILMQRFPVATAPL